MYYIIELFELNLFYFTSPNIPAPVPPNPRPTEEKDSRAVGPKDTRRGPAVGAAVGVE